MDGDVEVLNIYNISPAAKLFSAAISDYLLRYCLMLTIRYIGLREAIGPEPARSRTLYYVCSFSDMRIKDGSGFRHPTPPKPPSMHSVHLQPDGIRHHRGTLSL